MRNIYTTCKQRVNKLLATLNWRTVFKDSKSPWMHTATARQLIAHALLNQPANRNTAESSVDPQVLKPLLASISLWSKSVGPGHVAVEGDLSNMSVSDWLKLESVLLKSRLTVGPKFTVAYKTIDDWFSSDHVPNMPEILYSQIKDIPIIWATLVGSILLAEGLLFYFVAPNHPDLPNAFFHMFSIVLGLITVMVSGLMVDFRRNRKVKQAVDTFVANEVSATWDDVFSLKTQADALLVGMLVDAFNAVLEKNNQAALPDVMALSPKDAFRLVSRFFKQSGEPYLSLDRKLLEMEVQSRDQSALQTQIDQGTPSYLGYTFAALAANPVEVHQPQPVQSKVQELVTNSNT